MKLHFNYLLYFLLLIIVGATTAFYIIYKKVVNEAYESIAHDSKIQWNGETIEYVTNDRLTNNNISRNHNTTTFLIIHGGGGGFDQGKFVADIVMDSKYNWVAPSRFGYLGSSMPAEASISKQVDAYVALLDKLKIDKVIVIGLSAGGPSALHFALLKPERCQGLIMLSAVSLTLPEYDTKADSFKFIYSSDFVFYVSSVFFKKKIMNLFGLKTDLIKDLSKEQLGLFDNLLSTMLPANPRQLGIEYDSRQTLSNHQYPLENIRVSTLVVHAKDDALIPYEHGIHSATKIPGAKFISFDKGGHFAFGFEKLKVKEEIDLLVKEISK